MTEASTPSAPPPSRDSFATDEEFREAFQEWLDAAREAEEARENRAMQQLELWRLDHHEAARAWDGAIEGARSAAGLGLPVVLLPGLDDQGMCSCLSVRWRGDPRSACPSPGRHPDFGYRARAERDPAFAAGLYAIDTRLIDGETAPVPGVGAVLFSGDLIEIDIDRHGTDGFVTLAALEARLGELPPTLTIGTPRNGEHRIFIDPRRNDEDLYFRAGSIAEGIDLVANSQVTPMPPTRTPTGTYTLLNDMLPAHLPATWIEYLKREPPPVRTPGERREMPEGSVPALRSWVMSAVAGEAGRLSVITEGRNSALNLAAFRLGQIAAATEMATQIEAFFPEEIAYDHLIGACQANRYITDKGLTRAAATFRSGWQAGLREPRQDLPEHLFATWPRRSWDDLGMGQRFIDHFGEQILYSSDLRGWLIYEGGRWQRERNPVVNSLVLDMMEILPRTEGLSYDSAHEGDDEDTTSRGAFLGFLTRQRTSSLISRVTTIAQAHREIHAVPEEFDVEPFLLNVANGIIDLRTGNLLPHDPAARMMLQCPVAYDPDAKAPRWLEQFLAVVMPDEECRAYLQRLTGYSLTGSIAEQAMALHHGYGKNGKSVYLQVMSWILGAYSQAVPAATLLRKGSSSGIPNDIARMKGKRFLQVSETAEGKRMDEEVVKSLTGGEVISARFLHAEFFDFTPTGKIHFITNHLPDMSADQAVWRRIHFVPWDVVIPEEDRDKDLASSLIHDEGSGILNWAVQGCLSWQERGLDMPGAAITKLMAYREEQDYFGEFLDTRTVDKEDARTPIAQLYQAYRTWAMQTGHREMSQDTFSRRMAARGYERFRTSKVRGFQGITLEERPV